MSYLAKKYTISKGVGISAKALPSFDKALLDAGVGNYNLVRLSSILPAHCRKIDVKDITSHIKEGSLLPTAYSTISSSTLGERIVSTIGVGFSDDPEKVGVIMEYSVKGKSLKEARATLREMIAEAFAERGWYLASVVMTDVEAIVETEGTTVTTFACISEW